LFDHSPYGDYDYKPIRPSAPNYSDLVKGLPFREECDRILATFLLPGAVKELTLDKTMREAAVKQLSTNTHPDVVSQISEQLIFSADGHGKAPSDLRENLQFFGDDQPSLLPGTSYYQRGSNQAVKNVRR
jgi:hypothetical protein